ncbi:toxin-activating lysine-acyltransferase [Photobacterium leiognathi]|uniref:toxin-activating lysine-acyltransferase n=1 Tax=Photobacterium leiognathi TaxID=553611 RepID=UPI002981F262|nr:toxin-activating lysine-acyltransferase [Photobacterium leiognathi]
MPTKSITSINSLFLGREQRGKLKSEILQELGQLLEIAVKNKDRSTVNIGSFIHWIKPAILHDQYLYIKNKGDLEPSGYLIWAWVDTETLYDFFDKDRFIIHPMGFNDGKNLIILDFCYLDENNNLSVIKNLYRKARNEAGVSYKNINICIRDSNGLVVSNNMRR